MPSFERRIPEGDSRERMICADCGFVAYENPKVVVGSVVADGGRVLMCRRAIEPRRGYWTVPAGFLELGESAMQGAVRETAEEAGARVRIVAPYAHFDVPHIGQAYIIYRAALIDEGLAAGPESLEVKLVEPEAIPWPELAFPVVRHSLELVLEDRRAGRYRSHQGALVREDGRYVLKDHLGVELG